MPSAVWDEKEYEKLTNYDLDTSLQPTGLFQCHQNDGDDPKARICAGWVACHGGENLLGVRIAVSLHGLDRSIFEYDTDVPIFDSGTAAALHGMRDMDEPGDTARSMIEKIIKNRGDVTFD